MNYLQRYLDLIGTDCAKIATATGLGYHTVQKVVKGHRRTPRIREAIALALKLDPDRLWGRGSVLYLRKQIAIEAARLGEIKKQEILNKYLDSGNIAVNRKAVNV